MMAKLGDYISIKHGFAFKGKGITTDDNGIVLVTPGNFAIGGGFKEEKCKFFDGEYPSEYVLSPDDLIVTMTDLSKEMDTLGYSALVPLSNRIYLHNQRIGLISINSEEIDKHYLYWFMRTKKYQRTIAGGASGTTVHHTSPSRICDVIVEFPNKFTQKKIASILDDIEEKMKRNEEINENLLQQARALFRQWFSVTSSGLYKLSDIADINPETYSPKENWSFVNYLDTSNITSGTINEVQYIIPSEEKLPSRARRILRKDDVVFSTVRPNQLHYGIISNPKPNMLGSTGFAVIRSKYATMPNEIIYLALTESAFVEQMQQLAEQSVSTFPSIRPADLDACVLPEPKEDDNDFMETIKAIFNAVATNNEENQQLATLRDTLLPRLMSGELDVSSLDF